MTTEQPIVTSYEILTGEDVTICSSPMQLAFAALKADKRKPIKFFIRETFRREISEPTEPAKVEQPQEAP